MANTRGGQDGFQSLPKKKVGKKRLYVGNLPAGLPDLPERIQELFKENSETTVPLADIELHESNPYHAVVSVNGSVRHFIECLHRRDFEGKRLVVQQYKANRHRNGSTSAQHFGGWSKPKAEVIERVISEAMQESQDPITTALASVAAAGIAASADPDTLHITKDMSALLADYGGEDKNWKTTKVNSEGTTSATETKTNMLGQHGKAPIHVEFTSFGYRHGAPSKASGWGHADPFPPFDARDCEPIPQYLAWQDGLSGAVKRALQFPREANENRTSIRELSQEIASKTLLAVKEAINEGYGYTSPLRMVIYIGSELGRHRSVVACDLAATNLRKKLRQAGGSVSQPCSVGTNHLQLTKQKTTKSKKVMKRKEDGLHDN